MQEPNNSPPRHIYSIKIFLAFFVLFFVGEFFLHTSAYLTQPPNNVVPATSHKLGE